jgi:hypothetical protein
MTDDFAPPNNNKFVSIPNLLSAGLGETDELRTFYRREAFDTLAKFVDSTIAGNNIGLVDGLPGTGKSSTIWWALQQPNYHDKEVAWLHLDRSGDITKFAKKPKRGEFTEHTPPPTVETAEIKTIDADILVIDGVNHTNFAKVVGSLRRWVHTPSVRHINREVAS